MQISDVQRLRQLIREHQPISSLKQLWDLMKERESMSQLQDAWELVRDGREWLSRQLFLDMVMGFIGDCRIEGSYLEFGSGHGGSLVSAFSAASRNPFLKEMHFYVFDSFEGLPEPMGLDGDELRRYNKGDFGCALSQYQQNVSKGGVDLSRVTLTQGWYHETLNDTLKQTLPLEKAAVILVDCDLYESTVPVLDFVTEYIQTGTIIIFDDWFSYKGRTDRGEARAFREWLVKEPHLSATEFHKVDRTINSFIMQSDRL